MSEEHKLYNPSDHEPLPEGEEAPPPLVHTMALVRWGLLIGLAIFAIVMISGYFGFAPWEARGETATQYHCPMHPTYISNQPGECPICGMTLVPIDSKGDTTTKADTSKIAPAMPAKTDTTALVYTCPMHPEVRSDKPGKCPKCGMNLVPESELNKTEESGMEGMSMPNGQMNQASSTSDLGSAPVKGLVPVTIEPERLQLIGVKTGMAEYRSLGGHLDLVGFVSQNEANTKSVSLRINGWVTNLAVNEVGQFVKEGQTLMTIYSQDLYQAEQDYIVARKNAAKNYSDTAMAALQNQMLNSIKQRLILMGLSQNEINDIDKTGEASPNLIIRSPYSGYVLEKSVLSGQAFGPDQSLFVIADLSVVWVLADVYEQDIRSIKVGQSASLELTAFPGESFEGKIGLIYPSLSEQTRTLKVRLDFVNRDMKLRPGMYAQVEVRNEENPVMAVPVEAVLDGGEEKYVFVVHDKIHFEPRLVNTGRLSDDYIEILGGLGDGEEVVTSANFLIDSESRLKAAISGMGGTAETTGMIGEQPVGHTH